MSENNEKKLVTWEMFKKYYENLVRYVGYIDENDSLTLDEEVVNEDEDEI